MNKEVFSKFTFGFLMAQLFPGVVAVSAVCLAARVSGAEEPVTDLSGFAVSAWEGMFTKPAWIPAFLFVAVGTGMLIHGLNWTVLAWLENHADGEESKSASKSLWHGWPVVLQLLLGPIKMVLEILWLLIALGLEKLKMEENVSRIKPKHMPNFIFLQEFYLYFGQFYAHTAYALLFATVCWLVTLCHVGWSVSRALLLAALYLGASVFFLIGRVQLTTLFKAELELRESSEDSNGEGAE